MSPKDPHLKATGALDNEDRPPVKSMLGDGFYSDHSILQGTINHYAIPALVKAVKGIDFTQGESHFVAADYGCAQGLNSLEPMRAVVEAVRSRWHPATPISVVHVDLPDNDFSTLFRTVVEWPDSYLRGHENVYCFASANSIYQQSFPVEYVAVGYCANVSHWLSQKPCNLSNHIVFNAGTDEEIRQWAEQSARDWRTFLHHRATELKPSGRLIVVGLEADEAGVIGLESLLNLANHVLLQMVEEGELSPDEFLDMSLPFYSRKESEWTEDSLPGSDPVAAAHLALVQSMSVILSDPHFTQFRESRNAGDFAHSFTEFFRAWSQPCLFATLYQGRKPENRKAVIDLFYRRVQEGIAEGPYHYECHYRNRLLVFEK